MNQSNLNKIIQNNRIQYKYFIEKELESGLVLLGWEIKSIREKTISIENSYISFQHQEAYIYNSIFQTKIKNYNNLTYNPTRIRKLLLKKQELSFLKEKINNYRYTAIILNLFWKNSWVKAKIGIGRGQKQYDKRNIIKKKQWKLEKKHIINKNVGK